MSDELKISLFLFAITLPFWFVLYNVLFSEKELEAKVNQTKPDYSLYKKRRINKSFILKFSNVIVIYIFMVFLTGKHGFFELFFSYLLYSILYFEN